MLPSERREFVRTHRTCVFGYGRQADGRAMSIVYYIPADSDDLFVATMAGRAKAKAVARNGKVSLCVLDETWPFAYLQVYCDAEIVDDDETLIDVMMAVGERMSGQPAHLSCAPQSKLLQRRKTGCWCGAPLCDVRDAAATPPPQRPGGAADPLGLGIDALGCSGHKPKSRRGE